LAAHGEDLEILACTILIGLQSVTDRETDASTIPKMREALHAVGRNTMSVW